MICSIGLGFRVPLFPTKNQQAHQSWTPTSSSIRNTLLEVCPRVVPCLLGSVDVPPTFAVSEVKLSYYNAEAVSFTVFW